MLRFTTRACVRRTTFHTCAALAIGAGLASPAFAQRFQRYVGMPSDERPTALERNTDDGFVSTGRRDSGAAAANFGVYVTRLNSNGIVQWTTQVQDPMGPLTDVSGETVRQTANGHFIAGARRNAGILSMGMMRLDAAGNLVWANTYTATPVDGRMSVREAPNGTPNGDFAVATQGRETQFVPPPATAGVFIRTGPAGNLLNFARYTNVTFTPAPGAVWLSDIRVQTGAAGQGFYVCGGVDITSQGPGGFVSRPAMLVMNIAPNGAVVWAQAYSAPPVAGVFPSRQGATGLEIAANGELGVVGYATDAAGNEILNVMRLSPAGAPLFFRQFAGLNTANGFTSKNIREAPGNIFVIGCNSTVAGVPNGPMTILRTDAALNALTCVLYGPNAGPNFQQPATNAVVAGPNLDQTAISCWKQPPATAPVGMGRNDILLARANNVQRTGCFENPITLVAPPLTPVVNQLVMFTSTVGDFTPWQVTPIRPPFGQTSLCCPGDITGDNTVNFPDLNAVLSGFGVTYSFQNLNAVLANFGAICPP